MLNTITETRPVQAAGEEERQETFRGWRISVSPPLLPSPSALIAADPHRTWSLYSVRLHQTEEELRYRPASAPNAPSSSGEEEAWMDG